MRSAVHGFSLVELLITLAVLGIMVALAMPSYGIWIANVKIRTTAEAIQSGLQLARAEAVRRNAVVQFQLTSTLDDDCALLTTESTKASNWVVSYDDPSGKCGHAPLNEAVSVNGADAPRIIQTRPTAEGSAGVAVAADQSLIRFNGLGRVINAATPPVLINVGATCVADATAGPLRCLRVTVTTGGQIRVCDPKYSATGTDPQRCTTAG